MQTAPITKYRPFPALSLPDRTWPGRRLEKAPRWCSVDLRDGNQALAVPMRVEEKLEFFAMLVRIGFREIEVGFPSASQIEFDFLRRLVDEDRIPEGVVVQVLTQAREELIRRTFESLRGVRHAIVHLYNSTSPLQRRVTFGLGREEIRDIAVRGTRLVRELAVEAEAAGTRIDFEYSPESFSDTETDYALEVCEAVYEAWPPAEGRQVIFNLPATVEYAMPNVHADQIEWFCRRVRHRERVVVSLHTHNDRGTGVAATELGLLAGADRVEGTLFGNGERTGNVDLVTVALNLYTQGVDPGLDFSRLNAIREVYERCTGMEVPPRHPYSGELVFTAFSGSHQDAIKKGMAQQDPAPGALWQVPYIPIDPSDIGRTYRAIIRINAQSGKGGVAWVLERECGYETPKGMHPEIGRLVGVLADERKTELSAAEVREAFEAEFVNRTESLALLDYRTAEQPGGVVVRARLRWRGAEVEAEGTGNGPIDAFVHALGTAGIPRPEVLSYHEHALGVGADARAASYVSIRTPSGFSGYGAGTDTSIELASIRALLSAINRALARRG